MFMIGVFYYTLGNLSPKYRSSLVTIQLVAIVNYPLRQRYGHEAILRPFIDNVKALESVSNVFHVLVLNFVDFCLMVVPFHFLSNHEF